jgi:hypothetical protein
MAMAVIPFGLSWLLKEVPLRTTLGETTDLTDEGPAVETYETRADPPLQPAPSTGTTGPRRRR